MAKSKKNDENGLIALAIILIIMVVLVILLTPIVLFVSWLVNLINYQRNYRKKVKSKFWLTDIQKNNFKILAKNLSISINNISKAKEIGNSESLTKNQDGSFSARSKRGKEIRNIIDTNQNNIYKQKPEFDRLQELPETYWIKYRKAYSKMIGYGLGFIAWVISIYISVSNNFVDLLAGIKEYFVFPVKFIYSFFVEDGSMDVAQFDVWKNTLIIVGISVGVFLIGLLIGRIIASIKCSRPALVSMENVDQY